MYSHLYSNYNKSSEQLMIRFKKLKNGNCFHNTFETKLSSMQAFFVLEYINLLRVFRFP